MVPKIDILWTDRRRAQAVAQTEVTVEAGDEEENVQKTVLIDVS